MTNTPTRYATPEEVESRAAQWSQQVLECRVDGHAWRPARATHSTAYRFYYVVQRCPRCQTERHTEMTERGRITARWLDYPDGYLSKGAGRIVGDGRDMLRLAALTRVYDTHTTRKLTEVPHSKATREAIGMDAA